MVQVVSPVPFRSTGVDASPLAGGIGSLISQKINERLQSRALSGDDQAMARLGSRDPMGARQVGSILQSREDQSAQEQQQLEQMRAQEQQLIPRIAQGFKSATDKPGYLMQTAQLLRNQGMERLAADVEDDAQRYASDPQSVELEYEAGMATFTDPTQGQKLSADIMARRNLIDNLVGATNPVTGKPFTREEAAREVALRESGITARAGTTTGRERIAQSPELTEKVAESEAEIKERTKFAELTGSSRAKKIDDGFEAIGKADQNIGNIDRAIRALDEGANTGAIESRFFPTIKAASVALDQIQNELTLDVLNSATFGALSEEELKLAKQTALPTGLPEAELREWLMRKREAQEKLKAYFMEQVDFLDQGGTVAGFLRMKERGAPQQEQTQERVIEVDF